MSSGNVNLELDSESKAPYPRSVKTSPEEDGDDALSAFGSIMLPMLRFGRKWPEMAGRVSDVRGKSEKREEEAKRSSKTKPNLTHAIILEGVADQSFRLYAPLTTLLKFIICTCNYFLMLDLFVIFCNYSTEDYLRR